MLHYLSIYLISRSAKPLPWTEKRGFLFILLILLDQVNGIQNHDILT
jgi:hypothetical protein